MAPRDFLKKAAAEAQAGGHVFPEYAACEAALESAWGGSQLAMRANNLFGQKQTSPAHGMSLALETREFLRGQWVRVNAEWMAFSCWRDCFTHRMELLRRLAGAYPHYKLALASKCGEGFVFEVSKTWSTDPERGEKVLALHREYFGGGG